MANKNGYDCLDGSYSCAPMRTLVLNTLEHQYHNNTVLSYHLAGLHIYLWSHQFLNLQVARSQYVFRGIQWKPPSTDFAVKDS